MYSKIFSAIADNKQLYSVSPEDCKRLDLITQEEDSVHGTVTWNKVLYSVTSMEYADKLALDVKYLTTLALLKKANVEVGKEIAKAQGQFEIDLKNSIKEELTDSKRYETPDSKIFIDHFAGKRALEIVKSVSSLIQDQVKDFKLDPAAGKWAQGEQDKKSANRLPDFK